MTVSNSIEQKKQQTFSSSDVLNISPVGAYLAYTVSSSLAYQGY